MCLTPKGLQTSPEHTRVTSSPHRRRGIPQRLSSYVVWRENWLGPYATKGAVISAALILYNSVSACDIHCSSRQINQSA